MPMPRLSIRHQLLLLGALACASIWAGAFFQYLQLRQQSQQLESVRLDLAAASLYAEAARSAARERGLTNGWLSRAAAGSPAELSEARRRLDRDLAALATAAAPLPTAVAVRADELAPIRGRIDRHDIEPPQAFGFYGDLVGRVQDVSARRLADGMVRVGLPYEYLNHLRRAAELLAQARGLINGALQAGALTPATEGAMVSDLALLQETLHLHRNAVTDDARTRLAPSIDAPAVREVLERASRLLELHRLDALGVDAVAWWSKATEAVDTLQQAAERESAVMGLAADARIAELDRRLRLTVIVLVLLGIVTLGLVLGTVGRIVRGLERLLEGLDAVGRRRDFDARIEDSGHDEFGTISSGINRLIEVAGSVVHAEQRLSLTDSLTGTMNRRGFDRQISARTLHGRAHAAPMSLVMIDVDHFKSVNDTLGHASGDLVLKRLAAVLAEALRPDDVLARFGGEEFVALLPGCTLGDGANVAEKLRAAIQAHDFGIGRPVTASLGVAQWSQGQAPQALIAAADAQLYAAKGGGRNRVMPAAMSLAA